METYRNTPVDRKVPVRTYESLSQVVSHVLKPSGRVLVISEWGGRSVKVSELLLLVARQGRDDSGSASTTGLAERWVAARYLPRDSSPLFCVPHGTRPMGIPTDAMESSLFHASAVNPQAETVNRNGVEEIGGGGSGPGGSGGRGGGAAPRRVFNLHFFVEARTPKEERELKRRLNRPGSKWVAFGSTPPRSQGCKEAYSYVTGTGDGAPAEPERNGGPERQRRKPTSSLGLMSYTRYGECPSWYGAGRMCGLDLQAKRIESFAALPAKLRRKVLEVDPGFGEGPPATLEECRAKAAEERQELEERRRRRRRSWRRPLGILSAED